MTKPTNIIGWIQRGIKLNIIYMNQHIVEVYEYLRIVGFTNNKKYPNDKFLSCMQKMVRRKYKGYETIKYLIDFKHNPNPNRRSS